MPAALVEEANIAPDVCPSEPLSPLPQVEADLWGPRQWVFLNSGLHWSCPLVKHLCSSLVVLSRGDEEEYVSGR